MSDYWEYGNSEIQSYYFVSTASTAIVEEEQQLDSNRLYCTWKITSKHRCNSKAARNRSR